MRAFSLLALVLLIITGCATSGYQKFYKPFIDAKTLSDVELLKPNEEPKIYGTKNFDRDIYTLRSKMYLPIGYSSFNGSYEDEKEVNAQARRIGATVVLVNSKYTSTQASTVPLFVPSSSTTYKSGSVYAGNVYGGYSGTSTTYGTTVVPITTHQRRYDQAAMFFVKSTKKSRVGVFVRNLPEEQRIALERNTGALIDVVVDHSPAFYSNVLPGDVLIKINGTHVKNAQNAVHLMKTASSSKSNMLFTVIRNGAQKDINVTLNRKRRT